MQNENVTFMKYNNQFGNNLYNTVDDDEKKKIIIDRCINPGEVDSIRRIINKNKSVDEDLVVRDHGDWFSYDGESFMRTLDYEGIVYRLEINSDGDLFVYNQSDEMNNEILL